MAKAKTTKRTRLEKGFSMQSLFALVVLLGLLCILPWVSTQQGSESLRALQLSIALLLALVGGFFAGLQVASRK